MNTMYILAKVAKKLVIRAFELVAVFSLFFAFPVLAEWFANIL